MNKLICCLALLGASAAHAVTVLNGGALIQHKANYFDLAGKQLRFTPRQRLAEYAVSVSGASRKPPSGRALAKADGFDPAGQSWRVRLAFQFPFAGQRWNELYINLNGNITFGSPETTLYPQRRTWSDGTMRSFAASADIAALEQRQFMIAPLWSMYSAEQTNVSIHSTGKSFSVTWSALRHQAINEGYDPLGRNTFHLRLTPDGAIEFAYATVAERDGVTGIFPGPPPATKPLDTDGEATLHDLGSLLRIRTRRREAIVYTDAEGFALRPNGETICFLLRNGDQNGPMDCPVSSAAVVRDDATEFYLPKLGLTAPASFRWKAGENRSRTVSLKAPREYGVDLSSARGVLTGNVYEVFHYPHLNKSRFPAFKHIYRMKPGNADLGVILTDFRIDDIHNHGGSNRSQDGPLSAMQLFGSDRLLSATGPVFIGPRFSETRQDSERTYRNYAFGIGWMAHEIVHGWSAYVRWSPEDPWALLDATRTHWSDLMHTPVTATVAHLFTDKPYVEHSVMGGMAVVKNPDGSMSGAKSPLMVASGLSPYDLYLMGLLEPEEVPPTFFISQTKMGPNGEHTGGTDVPVRITDLIKYNGPRRASGRADYKLGIYLLHEDGRQPDPVKLAQARDMEAMLIRYFDVATDGRMKVLAAE